ncbi:isoprenyl transferase [Frisingicoccus sp.]|uniref:isoprenyl transferase n=1 Tax=Frisingicoccus sp. TaxID=1918627 RepID=UPI0026288A71|nr:isoprenyl transferase [Frisingicoccus sp.]MDD6233160.1 isoprenyl transferase [Frisingicoccus sp.]MDY4835205.1 isoprenyl transferase [Frisingicoccus sp.]MDY4921893.1 isoprenyl transferase [Frisingicoccus sp.]
MKKKENCMKREIDGELLEVPEHVAIILDGNGRWAKKRLMPRNYGHAQGSKTVEQICEDAWNLGIKYLTVYAFSTENWSRPKKEVDALMKLLRSYLKDCIKRTTKNNMRVRVIGDKTGLSEDIRNSIEELERVSAVNTGLNFTIAINYGSRDEMRRAMVRMAKDVEDGKVKSEEITEEVFKGYLDTWELPDPDLLIRTSGEQRLSNFLLWQLAYTEFVFMEVLWPDFNRDELVRAIRQYNGRERRFGGI